MKDPKPRYSHASQNIDSLEESITCNAAAIKQDSQHSSGLPNRSWAAGLAGQQPPQELMKPLSRPDEFQVDLIQLTSRPTRTKHLSWTAKRNSEIQGSEAISRRKRKSKEKSCQVNPTFCQVKITTLFRLIRNKDFKSRFMNYTFSTIKYLQGRKVFLMLMKW